MSDIKPEWVEAGRAVVIAENGECVRASLTWCEQHESRVRKGMSVCDVFVDLLGLMEEVIAAVAPLIREAVANEISSEITATFIPDMRNYGPVGAADWMRTKAADIAFRIGEGND